MTYYNSRGVAMPETEPEQGRIAGTSAGNETMYAPDAPGSSVSGEGGGDLLIGNSYGNRYWINDPWQYRLPEAYGPYRWVRYYDDALLVDIYSGEVVDVMYDFFW